MHRKIRLFGKKERTWNLQHYKHGMERRVLNRVHGVDGSFLGDRELVSLFVPPDQWGGQYISFSSARNGRVCLAKGTMPGFMKGGRGGLQANHHLLGVVLKRDCANFAGVVHLQGNMVLVSQNRVGGLDLWELPTEKVHGNSVRIVTLPSFMMDSTSPTL